MAPARTALPRLDRPVLPDPRRDRQRRPRPVGVVALRLERLPARLEALHALADVRHRRARCRPPGRARRDGTGRRASAGPGPRGRRGQARIATELADPLVRVQGRTLRSLRRGFQRSALPSHALPLISSRMASMRSTMSATSRSSSAAHRAGVADDQRRGRRRPLEPDLGRHPVGLEVHDARPIRGMAGALPGRTMVTECLVRAPARISWQRSQPESSSHIAE
jgi:hypothetical protein